MRSKAIFMALLALSFTAQARPVLTTEAVRAARTWIASGSVLGSRLGATVDPAKVRTVVVDRGVSFYLVPIEGGGTVVTSSDTESEPIVLFTDKSVGELDPKGPLYGLLARDAYMRARLSQVRAQLTRQVSAAQPGTVSTAVSAAAASLSAAAVRAGRQWDLLAASASSAQPVTNDPPNRVISDLRVPALVKTKWSQSTVDGEPFYNYWIDELVSGGKLCGCTATAMAQLIRYFAYPATGASAEYECTVDGKTVKFKTFGGTRDADGNISAYDYANMPFVPSAGDDGFEQEQQAVGSLTHDCAVALGSSFADGATSAFAKNTAKTLRNQFDYASAFVFADQGVIRGTSVGLHDEALREKTIYANLDAGKPVQLGIYGYVKSIVGDEVVLDETNVEGHSVLADGYGFTALKNGSRTAYVHVNLGWSGTDDAWYNIPEIDTATVGAMQGQSSGFDFLYLGEATFNVVSNDAAEVGREILSGRVLKADGTPSEGAEVLVLDMQSEVVARTTSNSNGIYVAYVAGGAAEPESYEVWAADAAGEQIAASETVYVRQTSGDKDGVITLPTKVGNRWGVDITLAPPAVRLDGNDRRVYPTLDKAFAAIYRDGAQQLEILRPVELKGSLVISNDLTICATNPDPRASEILRADAAQLIVRSGATVTLTNVAFRTEATTPVKVLRGGCVRVSGIAVFDDIASGVPGILTEDSKGFVLNGELLNGLTLQCDEADAADKTCGLYSLADAEAAKRSAARIVSPQGVDRACVTSMGIFLKWADGVSAVEETAVAYVAGGEEPVYYRTLDRLFGEHPDGTNVVITKSGARLENPCAFTAACSIFPAEGLGVASVRAADTDMSAAFTLGDGATLAVGDLLFEDYEGAGLFLVNGDSAALSVTNVTFRNIHGNRKCAAAIHLANGSARVTDSTFENCKSDARGGAICVDDGCRLELKGGSVTGCWAKTRGGGICAMAGATVRVSGALRVRGNTYGSDSGRKADDIYLVNKTARLEVCGELTDVESVGVQYGVTPGDGFGNAAGNRFAIVATESAVAATNSAAAFFNDVNAGLVAQVSDDGDCLVWAQPKLDTHQLDKGDPDQLARAVVRVVKGGEVAYYEDVGYAFAWIDAPATVELLKDAALSNAVEVSQEVLFRSEGDVRMLTRTADVRISVLADGFLTVEDVTVDGGTGACGLFNVSGGTLVLDDGATVQNACGSDGRASGAVSVWDNGLFEMNDGAAIVGCSNSYANEGSKAGYGGGLLSDASTVWLKGGRIEGCSAYSAGGAFVGNGSTVYISGDVFIAGNTSRKGDDNLCVSDDSELLLVDTPFSGAIGYMPGASADPNVFGRVDGSFGGSLQDALVSAHGFTNDVTRDVGLAVTNADETLLVWGAALAPDRTFKARDGKTYGLVEGEKVPVPVPEAKMGLRYAGEVLTGVEEGVGYVLEGNTAVLPNAYRATATLRPGFVWDDGMDGPKTVEWTIDRGFYVLPDDVKLADAEFPYDGQEHALALSGEIPDWLSVTYVGNSRTLPGTNDVAATISGESSCYEWFERTLTAKLVITGTYDPQQPDPGPVPPIDDVAQPLPIAFASIANDQAAHTWTVAFTQAVATCWYSLYETNSLVGGFKLEGISPVAIRQATAADVPEMTFTRPENGEHLFWKVVAEPSDAHTELDQWLIENPDSEYDEEFYGPLQKD